MENTQPNSFLDVRDLRVHFPTDDGVVRSVDGISFALERGKTLGIVGESGSGKSVTSLALLGLHRKSSDKKKARGAQISGEIWLDGQELVSASAEDVRKLRGQKMAMIFQDPLSAMHPFYTVGAQIIEAYRVHNDVSKAVARKRAIELLERVRIPEAARRIDSYPHELSGGQRQRVGIAIALALKPQLLIADEPTTALDVTVQKEILDILDDLVTDMGMSLIFISHDIGVIGRIADRTLVMFGGKQMEQGPTAQVLRAPVADYTRSLLAAMPRRTRGSLTRGSLAAGLKQVQP